MEHYLSHVALMTNMDAGSAGNAVKMMTVHTAKGLEFDNVFLCGLEEGVFPSKKTSTLEAMEEERRLAFVAFTRAKQRLFLSDSEGRNLDGTYRYPSRFIFNVDKTLLEYTHELSESLVAEINWSISSSERTLESASELAFKTGDRVVHNIMGAGVIVDIDRDKAAYVIKFDILDTPRNINFKVKLERETPL